MDSLVLNASMLDKIWNYLALLIISPSIPRQILSTVQQIFCPSFLLLCIINILIPGYQRTHVINKTTNKTM